MIDIKFYNGPKRKGMTPEQRSKAIELYMTGKYTCAQVGRDVGCNKQQLRLLFKKAGIKVNNDPRKVHLKYSHDEDFFGKIDSEEKAYWLGFLCADGCNNEKNKSICLGLAETDSLHIEKFKNAIRSGHKIQIASYQNHPTWQNRHSISVRSPKMSADLAKQGCFQNKSLTLKFPTKEQVPDHLLRHFIRGYFDGDGCFYVAHSKGKKEHNKKVKKFRATIMSSVFFCDILHSILDERVGIKSKKQRRKNYHPNTAILEVNNTVNAFKFLDWIYYGSNIYLNRKHQKYIDERADLCARRLKEKMPKIDDPNVILSKESVWLMRSVGL